MPKKNPIKRLMGGAHSFVFFFGTFFFGRCGCNTYLRWIYSVVHLGYLCRVHYLCMAGRKRKRALQGCNPPGIHPAIEASSFFDNGAKKIAPFGDKGGWNSGHLLVLFCRQAAPMLLFRFFIRKLSPESLMISHRYRSLSRMAVVITSSPRFSAHCLGDLLVVITKDTFSCRALIK